MIYAISDMHGCYNKYKRMLEKINFSEEDTLYVLGDSIDRGEKGGIDILLDMMERKNVIPISGNHEFSALDFFVPVSEGKALDREYYDFEMWMMNGGKPTLEAFEALGSNKQKRIVNYIKGFKVYDELRVGENKFFLSHTVPEKDLMLRFDEIDYRYLLFAYPEYDKVYFENVYIVTGHVPTVYLKPGGGIVKKNNHIAIDCGAVFGKPLGCICLDTLEEFYVE